MTGEVKTELNRVLNDLRKKTGIDVRLEGTGEDRAFPVTYCNMETTAYIDKTIDEKTLRLVEYFIANADYKQLVPEKGEYLKSILLGEGNKGYAYRFMTKYNLSDGECCAVEIVPEHHLNEAFELVLACLADGADLAVKMDDSRIAVVKFAEQGQNCVEFGQFLAQSLAEEVGVKAHIGVGCEVKSFAEISSSYAQAATAVRMSGIFHSKGTVHSYRDFLLVKMIEDVPQSKLQEYLEQFRIDHVEDVFSDEDMANTAEEFLANSLNISETSRNLYMHRNTLMYRLDKIERMTGLNIRNFSDAVTFRVVTILYKLLQL